MTSDKSDLLGRGIQKLGLTMSDDKQESLLAYLDLIIKWNKAYNLTAIREPLQMVRLHLLDSLSIAELVERIAGKVGKGHTSKRMIDVGTGVGLPGVVLAILYPEVEMSLLDTNGKKCRFLNQVKTELSLTNVDVVHHRLESYEPEEKYSVVISRAFATLKDMTDNAQHLLLDNGCFLAMKGRYPEQEIKELNQQFSFEKAYPLQIPDLDVERYLIEVAITKHEK